MKERRSVKIKSELLLKNIPLVPRLTIPRGWSAVLEGEKFTFVFKGTKEANLHHDPYTVRKNFLAIKTPAQGLAFFRRYGPFDVRLGSDFPPVGAQGAARQFSFEELQREQNFYRKVLSDPRYWQTLACGGMDATMDYFHLQALISPVIKIPLVTRTPFLLMESVCVSQAIYATVYLDWIQNLKSIECAECGKIVRQNDQHFLRFCSIRCGNINRKRKYNKEHGITATKGTR
jgi:endogenous inhibitor of DNA gyrase (YacG/DUF329 family)